MIPYEEQGTKSHELWRQESPFSLTPTQVYNPTVQSLKQLKKGKQDSQKIINQLMNVNPVQHIDIWNF